MRLRVPIWPFRQTSHELGSLKWTCLKAWSSDIADQHQVLFLVPFKYYCQRTEHCPSLRPHRTFIRSFLHQVTLTMLGPTLSTTLFALALLIVSSLSLLLPSIPALSDTSRSPSSLSAPLSILHLNASGLNTAYKSTNTKAVGIHGHPTCSAVEYGDNLNVQGCREAVQKMKRYRNQIQFGNRGTGSIVQTPRRFASRK